MTTAPTEPQAADPALLQARQLVEYQKAQDSAQHHDTLVATTISTFLGASLVLLGFVLNNLQRRGELRLILTLLAVVAALMTITVGINAFLLNWVKRQKYERCKALEVPLGFEQHRGTKYWKGAQRFLLCLILMLLLVAWGTLILFVNGLWPFS